MQLVTTIVAFCILYTVSAQSRQFRSSSINELVSIVPIRHQVVVHYGLVPTSIDTVSHRNNLQQYDIITNFHRQRLIQCIQELGMFTQRCRYHRRCVLFPWQPRCISHNAEIIDSQVIFQSPVRRFSQARQIPSRPQHQQVACNITCPEKTHFYGGQCQAGASLCNPGCPDDYTCYHGKCQRAPCSPACSNGLRCRNRQCIDVERCEPACCPGQICKLGRCEDASSKGQCNPSCPPGYICHDSHCDKDQQCKEPCPPGYECHSGHCHREGLASTHSHCDPPCIDGQECHDGHCEAVNQHTHHGSEHGHNHDDHGHSRDHSHGHGHSHGSHVHNHGSDTHSPNPGTQGSPPGVRCNPPCSAAEQCFLGRCDPIIPSVDAIWDQMQGGSDSRNVRRLSTFNTGNTGGRHNRFGGSQRPRTSNTNNNNLGNNRGNTFPVSQPIDLDVPFNLLNPSQITGMLSRPTFMPRPVQRLPIQTIGQGVLPSAVRPVPITQVSRRHSTNQRISRDTSVDSWFTQPWSDDIIV